MTDSEREKLRLKAEIFRALGQPTRLGIMEALDREEMHVRQLAQRLETDMAGISKHLTILRKLGLVASRRDGLRVVMHASFSQARPLLLCVEDFVVRRFDETPSKEPGRTS
jgi:ArsR family transcriptional regulator